jgi:SEC-C motif-containing protein
MRARYSAFARKQAAFLIRTAHPSERMRLRPDDFAASFALSWLRLTILHCQDGGIDDSQGLF